MGYGVVKVGVMVLNMYRVWVVVFWGIEFGKNECSRKMFCNVAFREFRLRILGLAQS